MRTSELKYFTLDLTAMFSVAWSASKHLFQWARNRCASAWTLSQQSVCRALNE